MKNALKLLHRIAKIREDQTISQFKKYNAQLQHAEDFNQQINNYVHEYEHQMVETAKQGVSVAYLQDSTTFRNRLTAGAQEQRQQIDGLNFATQQAKEQAIEAKLRVQGIQRVLDKKEAESKSRRSAIERSELEESYAARHKGGSGTEDA
jgi:flagellar export protein FliJ